MNVTEGPTISSVSGGGQRHQRSEGHRDFDQMSYETSFIPADVRTQELHVLSLRRAKLNLATFIVDRLEISCNRTTFFRSAQVHSSAHYLYGHLLLCIRTMRYLLPLIVGGVLLHQQGVSAPPLPTERDLRYFHKFDWPIRAMTLMRSENIPAATYTAEEASNFVTHGMVYLERMLTSTRQLMNSVGSNNEVLSKSIVHGIDDIINESHKPRWRWLPLIDRIDSRGQLVHHPSTWESGEKMKSMDLLRLDAFHWNHRRLLMPTAIVRPIQRSSGFGQGLQFSVVYEFPTSFAHYMRDPTQATAERLHDALKAQHDQWTSLVSRNRLGYLRRQLALVSPDGLRSSLDAYLESVRRAEIPRHLAIADPAEPEAEELESPSKRFRNNQDDFSHGESDHGSEEEGDTLSPRPSARGDETASSSRVPGTDQPLDLNLLPAHTPAVLSGEGRQGGAQAPDRGSTIDNTRLHLGLPERGSWTEAGSSSDTFVPGTTRRGTARWRRPPQQTPEQSDSP